MSKTHVRRVKELYKLILRLHRSLPDDLKILGDNYAKEEFKRHKKCQPQEARIFLNEWRDYAMSLSRQASPAREPRAGPSREERPGPSREVRPGPSREAIPGPSREAIPGPSREAIPGPSREAIPGPSREVRPASPQPPAAEQPFIQIVEEEPPQFGAELPADYLVHLTPEQLYTIYLLQVNARGYNPNDSIDEGIELIEPDEFVRMLQRAKAHIIEVTEREKEQLFRGEIDYEDITFQSTWWLELFDDAITIKNQQADVINARMAMVQEGLNDLKVDEGVAGDKKPKEKEE